MLETVPGRRRRWHARFPWGPGTGPVVLRNYIDDQGPDEDIQDDPPTETLTWGQWLERHAEFGLDVAGQSLEVQP